MYIYKTIKKVSLILYIVVFQFYGLKRLSESESRFIGVWVCYKSQTGTGNATSEPKDLVFLVPFLVTTMK